MWLEVQYSKEIINIPLKVSSIQISSIFPASTPKHLYSLIMTNNILILLLTPIKCLSFTIILQTFYISNEFMFMTTINSITLAINSCLKIFFKNTAKIKIEWLVFWQTLLSVYCQETMLALYTQAIINKKNLKTVLWTLNKKLTRLMLQLSLFTYEQILYISPMEV